MQFVDIEILSINTQILPGKHLPLLVTIEVYYSVDEEEEEEIQNNKT